MGGICVIQASIPTGILEDDESSDEHCADQHAYLRVVYDVPDTYRGSGTNKGKGVSAPVTTVTTPPNPAPSSK